jgi:hypothetical protein
VSIQLCFPLTFTKTSKKETVSREMTLLVTIVTVRSFVIANDNNGTIPPPAILTAAAGNEQVNLRPLGTRVRMSGVELLAKTEWDRLMIYATPERGFTSSGRGSQGLPIVTLRAEYVFRGASSFVFNGSHLVRAVMDFGLDLLIELDDGATAYVHQRSNVFDGPENGRLLIEWEERVISAPQEFGILFRRVVKPAHAAPARALQADPWIQSISVDSSLRTIMGDLGQIMIFQNGEYMWWVRVQASTDCVWAWTNWLTNYNVDSGAIHDFGSRGKCYYTRSMTTTGSAAGGYSTTIAQGTRCEDTEFCDTLDSGGADEESQVGLKGLAALSGTSCIYNILTDRLITYTRSDLPNYGLVIEYAGCEGTCRGC